MTKTYREAYAEFRALHPEMKISETTFRRCKPFYVRPASARDFQQRCCQKCTTVKKAFRAMQNFKQNHQCRENFSDLNSLIEATLCPKAEGVRFHKLACIKQECDRCGIKKLHFCNREHATSQTSLVTWYRFETKTRGTRDGKQTSYLDIVKKETPPLELLEHFKESLIGYPYHLFVTNWQRTQWKNLLESLPEDHLILEMDFSENVTTIAQEAAQSMHWNPPQIAIHSCVLWRSVVASDNSTDSHVKEHWLLVSDDIIHDFEFVHHTVTKVIVPELAAIGCKFTTIHQRTDGCAGQYKSKNAFGDVSSSKQYINAKVIANFSSSGHGKGEVDAAAGYLKSAARRAIIRNVDNVSHDQRCSRIVQLCCTAFKWRATGYAAQETLLLYQGQ